MPDYSKLAIGDITEVKIEDLHPTQFRVGRAEVADKQDDFENMKPKELKRYLKTHPCPVVIGPGGVPYVTDEQHRANAAAAAEDSHHAVRSLRAHGHPTMDMKVIANWSNMTPKAFAARMVRNHYAYLKDRGEARPFSELPETVDEMKNDPYRSIAGFLERRAFKMPRAYFIQFQVAEWLRKKLKMDDDDVKSELDDHRKEFLKKVTTLLQSNAAKAEPWYLDPRVPEGPESCEATLTGE